MRTSNSPNRILVIGRENGPITQLLKLNLKNTKIGSVDVLGNMETRKYSEWKFSVKKQVPDSSLDRKKRKTTVDLLYELAVIMLEEQKFDQVIPLAPFHKHPHLVKQLRNACKIPLSNQKSLEISSSDFVFINHLIDEFTHLSSFYKQVEANGVLEKDSEGLVVTDVNRFLITKETKHKGRKDLGGKGYFLPFNDIHCAGFFSSSELTKFLGFQTLKPPDGHEFFHKDLEKNSYYPFVENPLITSGISTLTCVIQQLKLVGLITIFFGVIENQIVPFSCNTLPDENIDLWMKKTYDKITPHLVKYVKNPDTFTKNPLFGYKTPLYPSKLFIVPEIPPELATQRNLPGISAHNDHPICAICCTSNSFQNVRREMLKKRERVQGILDGINL